MTSIIKVDEIQRKTGTGPVNLGGGQILEILSSVCDGSSITVGSGTYTFENVSAKQSLTTTHTDVTGSSMNYTPPSGTTRVEYDFNFFVSRDAVVSSSICHFKFVLDGVDVNHSRTTYRTTNMEHRQSFKWVVNIGGATNTSVGRLSSWTSGKIMKLQAREYNNSHLGKIHETVHWDGGGGNILSIPNLTITAIR